MDGYQAVAGKLHAVLIMVEGLLHAASHTLRHRGVILHHNLIQHAISKVGVQLQCLEKHLYSPVTVGSKIGIQHISRDAGKHCRTAPVQVCCILFLKPGEGPLVISIFKGCSKTIMLKLYGFHYVIVAAAVVLLGPVIKLFLGLPLLVGEHSSFALQPHVGIHHIHAAGGGSDIAVVWSCGGQHIHHLKDDRESIAHQNRVVVLHEHCGGISRHILGHGVHGHLLHRTGG